LRPLCVLGARRRGRGRRGRGVRPARTPERPRTRTRSPAPDRTRPTGTRARSRGRLDDRVVGDRGPAIAPRRPRRDQAVDERERVDQVVFAVDEGPCSATTGNRGCWR
jgi:hypothetical protein